jgi:hypothetical protein
VFNPQLGLFYFVLGFHPGASAVVDTVRPRSSRRRVDVLQCSGHASHMLIALSEAMGRGRRRDLVIEPRQLGPQRVSFGMWRACGRRTDPLELG